MIIEASTEVFDEMFSIVKSHKRITGVENNISLENFVSWVSNENTKCFCFLVDGKIQSFIITERLKFMPSWHLALTVNQRSSTFNPNKNGISLLHDYAISYWEARGLYSFFYFVPDIIASRFTSKTRQSSKKLQEYHAAVLCTIPKNTISDYPLIKAFLKKPFKHDILFKFCTRYDQ